MNEMYLRNDIPVDNEELRKQESFCAVLQENTKLINEGISMVGSISRDLFKDDLTPANVEAECAMDEVKAQRDLLVILLSGIKDIKVKLG